MNNLKLFIITTLLLFSATSFAKPEATATLNRYQINLNETVQLTIALNNAKADKKPSLASLKKNFDIIGGQQSSQTSWVNGNRSSSTSWTYQLTPREIGLFTIPPIEVSGYSTEPLSLQVKPVNNDPSLGKTDPIFIEAFFDKEESYVQEQIIFTYKVNSSLQLSDINVESPTFDNAIIKTLNKTSYQRMINSQPHITAEFTYAIFPQESGNFTIPPLTTQLELPRNRRDRFGSFFDRGDIKTLKSESVTINIKEVPANLTTPNWLPASNITIHDSWSSDPTNIKVGESITRTITTSSKGLTAEQLPEIKILASDKYKNYPDQAQFENKLSPEGIIGQRTDNIALVVTSTGTIELPEITIEWWNTELKQFETAVLPAVTLNVTGTINTENKSQTTPQNLHTSSSSTPENTSVITTEKLISHDESELTWKLSTAFTSFIALLFFVLWLMERNKSAIEGSIEERNATSLSVDPIQELRGACKSRDINKVHRSLIHWGQHQWPFTNIRSLADLKRETNSTELNSILSQLDEISISNNHKDFDYPRLLQSVENIQSSKHQEADKLLSKLYPAK